MTPLTQGAPVAAVDLGSNSFHLVVARWTDAGLRIEDRHREKVLLASGLGKDGRLDEDAAQRALECLRRFRQRLDGIPTSQVRVAATDTFRAARRPRGFRADAEEALGHAIEIVRGEEEARLAYRGVRYDLGRHGRLMLGFDVGGGSTEVFQGRGEEPDLAISLRMGSSSWSERYFPRGRIRRRRMERATLAARHELDSVAPVFRERPAEFAVGSSGTCLALARILQARDEGDGGTLRLDALVALQKEVAEHERLEEVDVPGLKESRRPLFLGGLCVLVGVMQELAVEEAMVSQGALREGLLLDLVGRLSHADLRAHTAEGVARRYHVDGAHAGRIAGTARRIADVVAEDWGYEEEDRLFLGWAACLHEIGRAVRHAGYQRHGAYLVENTDLPGYSLDEGRLLARLVRRHRGKLEKRDFDDLDETVRVRVLRLLLPLRLAVRLHRARRDHPIPVESMESGPRALSLRFPEGWLDENPLTALDLEEEAGDWDACGFRLEVAG